MARDMKQQKRLSVAFELKEFKEVKQEDGTKEFEFEGYASTFGNVDKGRDVVVQGAFGKTITEFNTGAKQIPILWQHDMYRPIGGIREMQEDTTGLRIKGFMPGEMAFVNSEVAPLMRSKILNALSIGYFTDRYEIDETEGVRKLMEVDLQEVSIVTFPMNEEAVITSVKSNDLVGMTERELEAAFREGTPFSKSAALQLVKDIKAGRQRESEEALPSKRTTLLQDILKTQRN